MYFFYTRRFLPLFSTQFFGAFNDNVLKNALVILITYTISVRSGTNAQALVTIAAGLFILPFLLFSATAGQVADKYDRAHIARIIKLIEIIIMLLASICFYLEHAWGLICVLFLSGLHSTFFGPIKYALLPQHLATQELLSGNAFIESATFLAILLGTIVGGVLIVLGNGVVYVSSCLLLVAVLGYVSSLFIPKAAAPMPELHIAYNLYGATKQIIGYSMDTKSVFFSILASSWFWFLGATYLSQFSIYVKDYLHTEAIVVTFLLAMFSIGIGVGSLLCVKFLRGKISTALVVPSLLVMSLFMIDLYFASNSNVYFNTHGLLSYQQFLHMIESKRILLDVFLISICAGVYIVPLYAIMQHDSDVKFRARIIAANNVLNALFMVGSTIYVLVLLHFNISLLTIFLILGIVNILVALYIRRYLTQSGWH